MNMLPDLFKKDLKIVFCGTAASNRSAELKAYYAKPGNSFWKILHKVELTPTLFSPDQYKDLLPLKIGLTDISKVGKGMDKDIKKSQFDVDGFRKKIEEYQPLILCFNGKKAAQVFFNKSKIDYGLQPQTIGATRIFVASSTSGAARGYWDESYWFECASYIISFQDT